VRAGLRWAAPLVAFAAYADTGSSIAAFSPLAPSLALPAGWREVRLPRPRPPEYSLVREDSATVLRVRSDSAAGSLAHAVDVDLASRPRLAWRWKIDRVVEAADLERKEGDDYAARVYVMFDVPLDELALATRVKIRLARFLHGGDVPAAAICYVWDNRHAPGTIRANAHVESVRMVVVESGAARAGTWVYESRDLAADFRAAFPDLRRSAPRRAIGVAVGNDTDQTGESVTAWFGDVKLEPAR
jgi:Protein of unknown function (DUF3047)